MSFDENLKRLEEIVKQLESGALNLEESLTSFEEGVKLCKVLETKLKEAEDRLINLNKEEK